MMAVTTKGLCATIALICVIAPIIIGHAMPVGTEDKVIYESGNYVSVASDLVNQTEIAYIEDTSVYNNVPFLVTAPVSIVSNPTPIVNSDPRGGLLHADESSAVGPQLSDLDRYTWAHFTINDSYPGVLSVDLKSTAGTVYTDYTELWIFTERDMYIGISEDIYTVGRFSDIRLVLSPRYVNYVGATIESTDYIDPLEGAYTSQYRTDYGVDTNFMPIFDNGFSNRRVSFNIENLLTTSRTQSYTVYGESGSFTFNLDYTAAGWVLSAGSESVTIGTFKQINLEVDSRDSEIKVSSLVRAALSDNPASRIIKTYSVPYPAAIGNIDAIALGESLSQSARIYCYSADRPSGTQNFIVDNSINFASYYPQTSISAYISGNAFYGTSVTLPGIGAAEVDTGRITFEDLTGEERTVSLRDSLLFALYDETTDRYEVTFNGYRIAEDLPAADLNATFTGRWLFNLQLAPTTSHIEEGYVFDFTTLNISMTEYAFIGLVTSVLAFVACAMIGRRSGTKVLSMLLIAGLAAMIYTAMLL